MVGCVKDGHLTLSSMVSIPNGFLHTHWCKYTNYRTATMVQSTGLNMEIELFCSSNILGLKKFVETECRSI